MRSLSSLLKCNNVNIDSHKFVYANIFVEIDPKKQENVSDNATVCIFQHKPTPEEELIKADNEALRILEADKKEREAAAASARWIYQEEANRLAEADREAQEIINSAKMFAAKIRSFAFKKAEIAYEEAKTKGFKEGYEAGKEIALKENEDIIEQLKQLLQQLDETRENYLEDYRQELVNLTFKIAEKIIGEKLDRNDSTFISIFKNAVKDLTAQKWVKLSVSEQDYHFATANAELLKSLISGAESIDIDILEDAPKGTCIIETNEKILDASVNTQLESLYKAVVNS